MKTYQRYSIKQYAFISYFMYVFIIGLPAAAGEPDNYPDRIVSLSPIITEMIYLLEADNKLIADTSYCIVPPDAKNKIKIGSVIHMDIEKIISIKPDIVLACSLSRKKQLKILKNFGIKVVQFENPETFSEMCRMTRDLGRIVGKEEKAITLVDNAQKEVESIKTRIKKLPQRKVFIQVGIKPLHTSPRGTFVNEYIEFSGGINIAMHEKSGIYSREKVLKANPDVILIATMGSSKTGAKKEKQTWMNYKSITAAKNGEIHVLDPELVCSPTPVSFVAALKDIVQFIHPDIWDKK